MDRAVLPSRSTVSKRLRAIPWPRISQSIDREGYAVLPGLLDAEECRALAALYDDGSRFRSRVVMARHSFGEGEYQYFAAPLPDLVAELREALYPGLADIATGWQRRLGGAISYPATHAAYLARCHEAGQTKPTPLLLRYGPGDYNCLHQDLYGELIFPLQATILLARPGQDFTGGEFVLTEQRPRRQSRAAVVALGQGDGVLFPVRERPVAGVRGDYRALFRHGVSRVHSGRRHTLGIIFHDAR